MEERIERGELEMTTCEHCHKPAYVSKPELNNRLLPEGLTVGNKRMFVYMQGRRFTVCQNCRYDVYGAY
jgi:hypothetical protein